MGEYIAGYLGVVPKIGKRDDSEWIRDEQEWHQQSLSCPLSSVLLIFCSHVFPVWGEWGEGILLQTSCHISQRSGLPVAD